MKTKFFTGKGDKGESDLGGGKKVSKSSCNAEFLGCLDELNSWLGVCKTSTDDESVKKHLKNIQESIFLIQAETASIMAGTKPSKIIKEEKTKDLENIILEFDKDIPQIKNFIIPGGCKESANLDFARTLARKTERQSVKLSKETEVSPSVLSYLNRLSSVLFVLSRYENHNRGFQEENPTYN
ncbi:MAG: cob(I)yrinic acid a,c-diamide adenosyltransferase [Candidatus Paceibacterota bacterium]